MEDPLAVLIRQDAHRLNSLLEVAHERLVDPCEALNRSVQARDRVVHRAAFPLLHGDRHLVELTLEATGLLC